MGLAMTAWLPTTRTLGTCASGRLEPAGQSVGGEFADWVLDLVDPAGFSSVLDAGAGVGRFTTRLAELSPAP